MVFGAISGLPETGLISEYSRKGRLESLFLATPSILLLPIPSVAYGWLLRDRSQLSSRSSRRSNASPRGGRRTFGNPEIFLRRTQRFACPGPLQLLRPTGRCGRCAG